MSKLILDIPLLYMPVLAGICDISDNISIAFLLS